MAPADSSARTAPGGRLAWRARPAPESTRSMGTACRDPNLAGGLPLQRHGTYVNMINEQIHQRVAEVIGAKCGDQDDLLTGSGGQQRGKARTPGRRRCRVMSTTGTGASGLSRLASPSMSMSSMESPTTTSGPRRAAVTIRVPAAPRPTRCTAHAPKTGGSPGLWRRSARRQLSPSRRARPAGWVPGRSAPRL